MSVPKIIRIYKEVLDMYPTSDPKVCIDLALVRYEIYIEKMEWKKKCRHTKNS